MTDFEKEGELSGKGDDMKEQNIVEQVNEKESSLAADQESVTDKVNLNKKKNDSTKTSDDSSQEIISREIGKDEASQGLSVGTAGNDGESTNQNNPQSKEDSLSQEEIHSTEAEQINENKDTQSEADQVSTHAEDASEVEADEPDIQSDGQIESPGTEIDIKEKRDEPGPEIENKEEEEGPTPDKEITTRKIADQEIKEELLEKRDDPKVEEPKTEAPKVEEPIAEDPKAEEPIAEDPNVSLPKVTNKEETSEQPTDHKDNESDDAPVSDAEKDTDEEDHSAEEDDLEDEEIDYSQLKKDELINAYEKIIALDDLKLIEKKIRNLKPFYEEIVEAEKKAALQKFMEDGGSEIDFQYVGDALDARYHNLSEKYKRRRNAYYQELEKNKDENLLRKQEVLEKLREIVDGEETNTSISALKNIQKEWRSIGPVPSSNARSLWATYNILIDRFYDNRSIYFELKELDRKKNLEAKLELCEKAEQLLDYKVIRDAVKELNELHEEFKHIGPVPKEMQEVVWQRFKSASDAIYERRKDYVSSLKKELHENLDIKKQLVEEVAKFDDYDSDKISEWNEKTKEILNLQKNWESVGGLPREHAKDVNKNFWSSFKTFFNNKNKFFKKLESQRDENLVKKEALVKRAEELKDSNDWEKTAETLKELQQEWKDTGPIPEKVRNEVYRKFKAACDSFFNRRREHSKEVESEYKVNLRKKDEICSEIEKMVQENDKNIAQFKKLQIKFNSIGYVPRNAIRKIQKKYSRITELFLNNFDLSETEKSELRFAAEVDKLKSSPNSDRKIQRKEVEVRRLIGKIENDIALWKNNIEFFAESKTADKVKGEFIDKIEKATAQLEELKEELKMLNKI